MFAVLVCKLHNSFKNVIVYQYDFKIVVVVVVIFNDLLLLLLNKTWNITIVRALKSSLFLIKSRPLWFDYHTKPYHAFVLFWLNIQP